MKRIPGRRLLAAATVGVALGFAGTAALAQADFGRDSLPERLDELPGRVEEAMRGLLDRMKPAIEDAFELYGVLEQIDSPANYDKPVVLPNGDILISRSPDAPDWDAAPDAPEDTPSGPRQRNIDPNEGTPI